MYDTLTFRELNSLQSILYEGTEQAYCLVGYRRSDPDWFRRYQSAHAEVAALFIEAATELLERIEDEHCVQAA